MPSLRYLAALVEKRSAFDENAHPRSRDGRFRAAGPGNRRLNKIVDGRIQSVEVSEEEFQESKRQADEARTKAAARQGADKGVEYWRNDPNSQEAVEARLAASAQMKANHTVNLPEPLHGAAYNSAKKHGISGKGYQITGGPLGGGDYSPPMRDGSYVDPRSNRSHHDSIGMKTLERIQRDSSLFSNKEYLDRAWALGVPMRFGLKDEQLFSPDEVDLRRKSSLAQVNAGLRRPETGVLPRISIEGADYAIATDGNGREILVDAPFDYVWTEEMRDSAVEVPRDKALRYEAGNYVADALNLRKPASVPYDVKAGLETGLPHAIVAMMRERDAEMEDPDWRQKGMDATFERRKAHFRRRGIPESRASEYAVDSSSAASSQYVPKPDPFYPLPGQEMFETKDGMVPRVLTQDYSRPGKKSSIQRDRFTLHTEGRNKGRYMPNDGPDLAADRRVAEVYAAWERYKEIADGPRRTVRKYHRISKAQARCAYMNRRIAKQMLGARAVF